jgi:hypothetical protein
LKSKLCIGTILIGFLLNSCATLLKNNYKTIFIASETITCQGVAPMECMQVKYNKNDKNFTSFYDQIEGFTFEKGYEYELLISEQIVENPPADASSMKYKLIKQVSKKTSKKKQY